MTDTKNAGSKKSSLNPLVAVGIGCLVLLVLVGIGATIAMRFFANKIGTSVVQSVIENQTGVKADLQDLQNGKMTFTDPKTGETVNIGTGNLPENFPTDFPQYAGAKVESSLTGSQTGTAGGFWVTFSTPDEMAKVVQFYKTELKNKGWTVTGIMDVGAVTTYTLEKGTMEGSVAVSSDGSNENTAIMVTLADKNSE